MSVREVTLDVDESFVGKMILFDAKLPHIVYPFYTSDECRITVSETYHSQSKRILLSAQ